MNPPIFLTGSVVEFQVPRRLFLLGIVNRHVFVLCGFGMPVRVGIRDEAASDRTAGHWLFWNCFVFLTHLLFLVVGNSAHSVSWKMAFRPRCRDLGRKGFATCIAKKAQDSLYEKQLDSGIKTGRIGAGLQPSYRI